MEILKSIFKDMSGELITFTRYAVSRGHLCLHLCFHGGFHSLELMSVSLITLHWMYPVYSQNTESWIK